MAQPLEWEGHTGQPSGYEHKNREIIAAAGGHNWSPFPGQEGLETFTGGQAGWQVQIRRPTQGLGGEGMLPLHPQQALLSLRPLSL